MVHRSCVLEARPSSRRSKNAKGVQGKMCAVEGSKADALVHRCKAGRGARRRCTGTMVSSTTPGGAPG